MSSPLILSVSTVFALIGIVLVAIAFGTNNWVEYDVNRAALLAPIRNNQSLRVRLSAINRSDIYFDRSYGLFRECFPNQTPNDYGTYISPLGSTCINMKDYQIPEDKTITEKYNSEQTTRMHLMRTTVAFYCLGLAFLFFCLFTGVGGCWRRHAGMILATGILLLFATLFLAAAMAVWHGVDYLQREVINTPPFYLTWPPELQLMTKMNYGWSYIISWIGIGFVLISSLLMLAAYRSMKEEEADELEKKQAPYMMANYYDKGAMMPYGGGYGTYPGYGAYPAAMGYNPYGQYGAGNGYYGYLTYGR